MAKAKAVATRTPEEQYAHSWRVNNLKDALVTARRNVPATEGRITGLRKDIENLEAHLGTLHKRRAGYVEELATTPEHTPGPGPDLAAHRRRDLLDAVAVLDGATGAVGTLCDDLRDQPRIRGTKRQIEEARKLLVEAEAELTRARQGIAGGEQKLRQLAP